MTIEEIRSLVAEIRVPEEGFQVDFDETIIRIKEIKDIEITYGIGTEGQWMDEALDISGYAKKEGEKKFSIDLNPFDPPNRRKFTFAHEIGHILLNHFTGDIDRIGDEKDNEFEEKKDKEEKKFRTQIFNKKDKEEIQANEFAAELLMPYRMVRDLFSENIIRYSDVLEGVEKFKVSEAAMINRFRFLDYRVAFI